MVLVKMKMESGFADCVPTKATEGAAAFDLYSCYDEDIWDGMLGPGFRAAIPCGFRMELPFGYEAQVRSRSGLALRDGLIVLNAPGTIDSDYRGVVSALMFNTLSYGVRIQNRTRIAQMVIQRVPEVEIKIVEELGGTARGVRGLGSTGTK